MRTIQYDALFDLDGFNPNPSIDAVGLIRSAEIVFAVDRSTGEKSVVSGGDLFSKLMASGQEMPDSALAVECDVDMNVILQLCTVCKLAKGEKFRRHSGGA